MPRRPRNSLLLAAIAALLCLGALAWFGSGSAYWVGPAHLEIEFVVTDAASGAPVSGANIEYDEPESPPHQRSNIHVLGPSGADGAIRADLPDSFAYGKFTRFGNTYHVSLPGWRFRATAPGFAPSDWVLLGTLPEHHHGARRIGPGRAKLVLPVTIRRQ